MLPYLNHLQAFSSTTRISSTTRAALAAAAVAFAAAFALATTAIALAAAALDATASAIGAALTAAVAAAVAAIAGAICAAAVESTRSSVTRNSALSSTPSAALCSPPLTASRAVGTTAWSKCPLGSAPARLLRLLRVRLAAVGSSALPGRGSDTGRPATAFGARANHLQGHRFHCV